MANSIWQATIQNEAGDIIPGAEITVTDEDTGLPATIFSSIGGAAKSNPFFADSKGFAQFYAGSGTYRVNAEDTGTGQSQLWRYIRFGNSASRDVGTSSGSIPDADDLGVVGNINWNGGNMQPDVILGLKNQRIMKNVSGAIIGSGINVAGSQLNNVKFDASGVLVALSTVGGTWRNTSGGGVANNEYREFTRIA